jgi:hypothetical protein
LRVPRKSNDTSNGAMETRSKRGKTEPIVDKIRRGEISVFVAVAEALPEVFRTHVVRKLELEETLTLAQVNKSYNAAVWSVEAVRSLDEKANDFAKLHSMISVYPPLNTFSHFNNVKAIKALISSGVDLEERSREGAKPSRNGLITALHVAAFRNNFETAKLLLEAGADVNSRAQLPKPNGGATPMFFAVCFHAAKTCILASPKLVSLLLEAGADVTLKVAAIDDEDELGLNFDTILGYHTDRIEARADVVKMFLDAGADPNGKDTNFGAAPLHHAGLCDDEEVKIGKLLLEYGADPLLTDKGGKTPLELAKDYSKDQDLINLLTEATEKALKSST